ncbi:MAG: hypothetical protein AB1765_01375 [Candidatus Hydrogenedentota bacterium]
MNEWVRKSIQIANSPGYLDNLHNIYSTTEETWRAVPIEIKKELEEVYKSGDNILLIKNLLKLPKFPIDDHYVAFLRKNEMFVKYNPKTVIRIVGRVRSLGFKAIIESIEEPKATSIGKKGNAIRIAVLDGVVWIKDSAKMYRTVCKLEKTVLTALLLKKLFESLRKV